MLLPGVDRAQGQNNPSALEAPSWILEVPPFGGSGRQSGIGIISGWVCEAETVEVRITTEDGTVHQVDAAYGTPRADTAEICGDSDNGFGLLFNWNLLGPGQHNVRLLIDGRDYSAYSHSVTVATLGTKFLQGASGRYTIEDFPYCGESVTLHWDEASQNFRLGPPGVVPTRPVVSGNTSQTVSPTPGVVPTGPVVSGLPTSNLESPGPNSVQSGIGVISGWVCEAETVAVRITIAGGAVHELPVAYSTSRTDTQESCGDSDNGFGLLFNWNLLGDGTHTVALVVDGTEEASQRVTVTTLGKEVVWGLGGGAELTDFPAPGRTVTVAWGELHQNFVIVAVDGR